MAVKYGAATRTACRAIRRRKTDPVEKVALGAGYQKQLRFLEVVVHQSWRLFKRWLQRTPLVPVSVLGIRDIVITDAKIH